jgi:DNA-directed RNA polymerase beta subunit
VCSDRIRRDKVFASIHYGQVIVEVPQNKTLLSLTNDKDNYVCIPKVGDHIVKGQVLAKIKAIDTEKHPDVIFEPAQEVIADETGEIIDIKIYANKWNKNFNQYSKFIQDAVAIQKQYRDTLTAGLKQFIPDEQVEDVLNTLDINKSEKTNYKIKGDVVDGVRIEITYKYERNLQLGDKLANRHGNKGTISRFVPDELMPISEDGVRADIVINPLGIVSRMNIGQVYEIHLSEAIINLKKAANQMIEGGKSLDEIKKYLLDFVTIIDKTPDNNYTEQMKEIFDTVTTMDTMKVVVDQFYVIQPPFQSIGTEELDRAMEYTNTKYESKCVDPVSGNTVVNDIVFGSLYFMKLNHISQDKIAYRGIGPYSAKTSQPLGGKTRKGGQRLGEMEVWAVIAHGDEENLREFITTKSDSISLRNKFIANCMGNDDLSSESDDDEVPQSIRLLQTSLASIGLGFQVKENDSDIPEVVTDEPLDSIEGLEEDPFDLNSDVFETED